MLSVLAKHQWVKFSTRRFVIGSRRATADWFRDGLGCDAGHAWRMIDPPASPVLSESQLATLRSHGEERSAEVGDVLFRVGDARYPLIAILEGEVAILDAAGNEIVRHGASGFLGELNLLTGQTVYLTAVVTQPMRYIAVDRDALRPLLFEDGPLGDLLLSAFMARREALQLQQGVGMEIIGPRSSEPTRRLVDYARRSRLPHIWRDPEHTRDPEAEALIEALDPDDVPLVRLPGGPSCAIRPAACSHERWGSGSSSPLARRSTWSSSAAVRPAWAPRSTAPPRASTRSSSRAPRWADRPAPRGGSRTTSASRPGSAARSSPAEP